MGRALRSLGLVLAVPHGSATSAPCPRSRETGASHAPGSLRAVDALAATPVARCPCRRAEGFPVTRNWMDMHVFGARWAPVARLTLLAMVPYERNTGSRSWGGQAVGSTRLDENSRGYRLGAKASSG